MKYISAADLRTEGYLQEINRCFLHPLGLAMEVDVDTDVIRIQDHRDDPEGVIYAWSSFSDDDLRLAVTRAQAFALSLGHRYGGRIGRFGFITQPLPEIEL